MNKELQTLARDYIEKMSEEEAMADQELKQMCKLLCQEEYESVVEERFVNEVCGYPLCGKKVNKSVRNQIYTISTQYIFQSSVRQKFCSNVCYFKSMYLRDQLSVDPAWKVVSRLSTDVIFFHEMSKTDQLCYLKSFSLPYQILTASEIKEIDEMRMSNKKCNEDSSDQMFDKYASSNNSSEENVKPNKSTSEKELCDDMETLKLSNKTLESDEGSEKNVWNYIKKWCSKMNYYYLLKKVARNCKESKTVEKFGCSFSFLSCSNPNVIRKLVAKERIHTASNSIFQYLDLPRELVHEYIEEILGYIEFDKSDILLLPMEWKIVLIVFINMFCFKEESLKIYIKSPKYRELLQIIGITEDQIKEVVESVIDDYKFYVLGQQMETIS